MLKRYRNLDHGEFIVVGVDTAAGGSDYCAAQFVSKTKLDVPIVYHQHTLASEMTPALQIELEAIHDITGVAPVVAYERNNGGVFELERLASLNRLGKYKIFSMPQYGGIQNNQPTKIGWDTNTATRPKMLADLKECIDGHLIRIYDKRTIEEMFSFIVVQTTTTWKAQAEQGGHDDLVMSLAIAWQLYQSEQPPQSTTQVQNVVNYNREMKKHWRIG
jgi:hypothetical protein